MKYKAILFDMDGTLVPMENEVFAKGYLAALAKKLSHHEADAGKLIQAVYAGTKAMVKNTGLCTNEDAFWNTFCSITDLNKETVNPDCLDFYEHEFHQLKALTQENPLAVKAVEIARSKADFVVLATNPIFPFTAQKARMSWVGLKPEDFNLVTSYETDVFCKPNPQYFLSIARRLQVSPQECLVIGNDTIEDLQAATQAGMSAYWLTNCKISHPDFVWDGEQGNFEEMLSMLSNL